ncbi:MAG: class I SAM-dependent methyltransferase [Thermodesulfobacteriota bacterium]
MALKGILQSLAMIPVHAVEGAAVRWRFAARLYGLLGLVYRFPRRQMDFGEQDFVREVVPGGRLLDLGCGPGYLTGLLEGRFRQSVGLDGRREMMAGAKNFAPGSVFVQADMTRLPFADEAFDAVVSLGAVHCVDYGILAQEICRVLTPGGEAHVLIEDRVIPLVAPRTSGARLGESLEAAGFEVAGDFRIGFLYRYIKARKKAD